MTATLGRTGQHQSPAPGKDSDAEPDADRDVGFSTDGSAVDTNFGWRHNLTYGIQHVLIMYVGCVSVPLALGAALGLDRETVAMLVNADLLVAGVITMIQSLGVGRIAGGRMPIIGGAAFVQVASMISIGQTYGLPAIWGCMLAGGVVGLLLAWPFSKLLKYFPPLVTGTVLLVLGVSLIGVSAGLVVGQPMTNGQENPDYADPLSIGIAALVVVVAVALSCLARGVVAKASLIIATIIGVLVCWPAGLPDFSGVGDEPVFALVKPFHFGAPEFPLVGVLSMSVVMMFLFAETIASVSALSEITGKKMSRSDVARSLVGDAASGVLGGIFNGFFDTVFNQNVGAVRTTRVHSRYVTATAGAILLLLGLTPATGAVIGGISLILFTSIAAVGVNTLRKVDLTDTVNSTIVAIAVALGLLSKFSTGIWSNFPDWAQTLLSDGVVLAALAAFGLNLLFNHTSIADRARAARNERRPEPESVFV